MRSERTIQSLHQTANQARQVMTRRLSEPDLGLADVAREIAVSKRQLQRAFELEESEGFIHELSRMRVMAAARLLRDDEQLTITEVVQRVGLRHRSNFARLFREHFGANPHRWRAQQRAARRSA